MSLLSQREGVGSKRGGGREIDREKERKRKKESERERER